MSTHVPNSHRVVTVSNPPWQPYVLRLNGQVSPPQVNHSCSFDELSLSTHTHVARCTQAREVQPTRGGHAQVVTPWLRQVGRVLSSFSWIALVIGIGERRKRQGRANSLLLVSLRLSMSLSVSLSVSLSRAGSCLGLQWRALRAPSRSGWYAAGAHALLAARRAARPWPLPARRAHHNTRRGDSLLLGYRRVERPPANPRLPSRALRPSTWTLSSVVAGFGCCSTRPLSGPS